MSTTQEPPPTVGIDDAFGLSFAGVRRELADLVDTPTWSLDDTRLDKRIGDVLALKAQVDELAARLVAEADDRNLPHRFGASSTRAHLMTVAPDVGRRSVPDGADREAAARHDGG